MHIRKILLHQLIDFVQSAEYQQMPVVPISPQRALSHSQNPRAQRDDLVLVLIYDEKEIMVGYLGVLPDELHFPTSVERVGWLSCMWVDPNCRGKGLSKKLIHTVFEAWSYKILVTEFTPSAKGLYDSTQQFVDLAKPQGVRCYLRPNLAYLLPNKNDKWKKWRGLLWLTDLYLSIPNTLRLLFYRLPKLSVSVQYMPEIDATAFDFIQQCRRTAVQGQELMNRQWDDFQWICRFPWITASTIADTTAQRYHFSSQDSRFDFLPIKVYEQQTLIGVLILAIRGRNLKVPYAFFEPTHTATIATVLTQHLLQLGLDMMTVFHPTLSEYFRCHKRPFFKVRSLQRHYIISKTLEAPLQQMGRFSIQDGDADAVFT